GRYQVIHISQLVGSGGVVVKETVHGQGGGPSSSNLSEDIAVSVVGNGIAVIADGASRIFPHVGGIVQVGVIFSRTYTVELVVLISSRKRVGWIGQLAYGGDHHAAFLGLSPT